MNSNRVVVFWFAVLAITFASVSVISGDDVTENGTSDEKILVCESIGSTKRVPRGSCDAENLEILNANTVITHMTGANPKFPSIHWIRINIQKTKYLPRKLSHVLPDLTHYEVVNSGLEFITRKNFEDLAKLKILIIVRNPLKNIPFDTFHDSLELKQVTITNNEIESIHPDTFLRSTKITRLNLSHNKIKVLPGSLFQNNLDLTYVNMDSNLLTTIGAELLSHLMVLQNVNFKNNICIDHEMKQSKEELTEKFTAMCQ